jgi:hypothetical protein
MHLPFHPGLLGGLVSKVSKINSANYLILDEELFEGKL